MDPLKDVMEEIETRVAALKEKRDGPMGNERDTWQFFNGGVAALNDLLSLLELYKTTHKL